MPFDDRVGGIDSEILHSAIRGVLTCLTCLISGGGAHVEHLLL